MTNKIYLSHPEKNVNKSGKKILNLTYQQIKIGRNVYFTKNKLGNKLLNLDKTKGKYLIITINKTECKHKKKCIILEHFINKHSQKVIQSIKNISIDDKIKGLRGE